MKKRLQGFVAGVLATTMVTGGLAYAKDQYEYIGVIYDDIKVYVDNVLTEFRDTNGSVVKPFIYNGSTYLPVRGAAEAAGMQVEWDGATKSVYLWKNKVPNGTYLMEVCPPYEKTRSWWYEEYLQSEGKSFKMSGKKYSNGITMHTDGTYAMFNLDGKYSVLNCILGRVDESDLNDVSVSFFVDGKLVKEIEVSAEGLPKEISVPLNYGLQLKIVTGEGIGGFDDAIVGMGEITVQ